ncbi:MerR family transcriptional regulator [Pedobacter frigiditerrae]|uniref:MerR family transcriptional regulator n=1 Tax=Pedobacter frigiditerrae TaxID=2530452 RepID=A0A4R0MRF3_9SPHI|nr:MerR family transcriptional regulator [Pedobacter frigiditerrae]TCC89167.1 MerR family transcriptional regulator [Pedobacter frigiditerrae]
MKLSISNLERLSGIPIHTIRIWERRYNALTPSRSIGNTRSYSDADLKRLLDISSLNQAGLKISEACALSPIEVDDFLKKDIANTINDNIQYEFYISQLLKFGIAYNETAFGTLITQAITAHGVEDSYQQIIYPLLQRLGLMWRRDNICPAQEHFISGIIRQKLMTAIDNIPLKTQTKSSWLLFLPEDEAHDIPLLFASYLLRANGFKVLYLGDRVPLESLEDAMKNFKAEHLLLFMVRQRTIADATNYLAEIENHFGDAKIHLAGNEKLINGLSLSKRISHFKSIDEFRNLLLN